MQKRWFIPTAILLTVFLGVASSQNAQDVPSDVGKSDQHRHQLAISLLRQINTAEVVEFSTYGSYASWPILLARYQETLDRFIMRSYPRQANVRFADEPEVLPSWSLRLNVHANGQGYDLLLRDLTDKKCGYAAGTDENAVIWQSKWFDCDI